MRQGCGHYPIMNCIAYASALPYSHALPKRCSTTLLRLRVRDSYRSFGRISNTGSRTLVVMERHVEGSMQSKGCSNYFALFLFNRHLNKRLTTALQLHTLHVLKRGKR